jgi:DUF4097 and DUF4098 domain-containing protein YvlB
MNRPLYMLLLLPLYAGRIESASRVENQFKKITSFFNYYSLEKTDYKELPAANLEIITIENHSGPITIKTGWKKDYLCLKTTKRSRKQKDLDAITITTNKTKKNSLHISTDIAHTKKNGFVEYELIVPASLSVNLKTHDGDISINDIQGTIQAQTYGGNIVIVNAKNTIHATSTSGDIIIREATGVINASSQYGNIDIHETCNSLICQSVKGKITVDYKKLPPTSNVKLETTSGNITLTLPPTTNATINGVTTHATLMSDHYIMLNPHKTQLNDYAWNKFKREVHGFIGSGDATISLRSIKGTIKILETPQT